MSQDKKNYIDLVIHRKINDEFAFGKGCIEPLLDQIIERYGTFGKANQYMSSNTLYTLKKTLKEKKSVTLETAFNLALTAGYKGFRVVYCDQIQGSVCADKR